MFKKVNIQNKIKKNIKKAKKKEPFNFSSLSKVAFLVDMDKIQDANFLLNFCKKHHIRTENYIILGYKQKSQENSSFGLPFFTWKEINFWGDFKNYHTEMLLNREFDLLFNYFDQKNLALELLSSQIEANLKVGFPSVEASYNDLIINIDIKKGEDFLQQVDNIIQKIIL